MPLWWSGAEPEGTDKNRLPSERLADHPEPASIPRVHSGASPEHLTWLGPSVERKETDPASAGRNQRDLRMLSRPIANPATARAVKIGTSRRSVLALHALTLKISKCRSQASPTAFENGFNPDCADYRDTIGSDYNALEFSHEKIRTVITNNLLKTVST